MNLRRRNFVFVVAVAAGVSLAACGSGNSSVSSGSTTTRAPVTTTSSAATTTTPSGSSTSSAGPSMSVVVKVMSTASGKILATTSGFALYTYANDHGAQSACSGSCAQAWPPLVVPANTTPEGEPGVTGTLGAARQANGTFQVTYNGKLIYRFASDSAGQVTGDGVAGFSVVKVS